MISILKTGAALVLSSMLSVSAHAILVVPAPERKPINDVHIDDVISRSILYRDFFNALFSPRNVMHSLPEKQYSQLLSRIQKAHTAAAHWLGITRLQTPKEKRLRYAAWTAWGAPLILALFQLDPSQFFKWLVFYPPVLQIFLHNYLMPFPGEIRRTTMDLISHLDMPVGLHEEEMIWYQFGSERNFRKEPRAIQGLVSFDVLEKLVTDAFSNSKKPSDALVEKWLFNVSQAQPWALEGWLLRFLQRNPEGLSGEFKKDAPVWSEAFRNRLLSSPDFWLKRTNSLIEILDEEHPGSVPAVVRFREQLGDVNPYLDSLPSLLRYRSRRVCQALFLWQSQLRVKP